MGEGVGEGVGEVGVGSKSTFLVLLPQIKRMVLGTDRVRDFVRDFIPHLPLQCNYLQSLTATMVVSMCFSVATTDQK